MATRIATAAQNAACDAVVDLIDGGSGAGYCEIRTGSQPATANTAVSGSLLATITYSDPAFGAASSGTATADITPALTVAASGTGTAGWFRMFDSAAAGIYDGSITVTGGGGDMTVNTTSLVATVNFTITAQTLTMPAS
jgi:hypothetical protein